MVPAGRVKEAIGTKLDMLANILVKMVLTSCHPQKNIWRLPTVEESVRSMARHGENSNGEWDAVTATATYETTVGFKNLVRTEISQ